MKNSDPSEMGNKQENPYDCHSLLPWESFQAVVQGGETQAKPSRVPELWIWSCETRQTKAAKVCKPEYQTEERSIESELWRSTEGTLEYSTSTIHTCIWRNCPRPGKGTPKKSKRKQYSALTKDWERCQFPWARVEKRIKIYGAPGRVYSRVFFQYWGIINPRLSIALVLSKIP